MTTQPSVIGFLAMQRKLQIRMKEANPTQGGDPFEMSPEELQAFIHWNFMALIKELGEATDEVSWKPWASGEFINYPACLHEMVDAWHFFLNLMLAFGAMSGHEEEELGNEFTEYYKLKNAKNLQRQIDGYDGVSTKCPNCKRELSEVANPSPPFCSPACADAYEDKREDQHIDGA